METGKREVVAGRAYLVLSVLRSDARALSDYLRRKAGLHLASSFERDVFAVAASDLRGHSDALRAEAHRLVGIRSALEGIAGSLRLELRRAFLHDLPAPEALPGDRQLREALQATIDSGLSRFAGYVLDEYADTLSEIIESTVERWDPRVVTDQLELLLGRDLQFIRINGTLVGGLIGLGLHTFSQVIG